MGIRLVCSHLDCFRHKVSLIFSPLGLRLGLSRLSQGSLPSSARPRTLCTDVPSPVVSWFFHSSNGLINRPFQLSPFPEHHAPLRLCLQRTVQVSSCNFMRASYSPRFVRVTREYTPHDHSPCPTLCYRRCLYPLTKRRCSPDCRNPP